MPTLITMSDYPRPDLGKILPRPLLRAIAPRHRPLAEGLRTPEGSKVEDFIVEIERQQPLGAEDTGFGISQAMAVAGRVRQTLQGSAPRQPQADAAGSPPVHRPDAERVQRRLFDA